MPRGGARPGAGRPKKQPAEVPKAKKPAAPKPDPAHKDADGFKTNPDWPFGQERPPEPEPPEDLSNLMPLDFLLSVMRDPKEDKGRRMQAATLAAPFCHAKKAEKSAKQQEAEERKKTAGAGRFGRRQPPALTAVQGGKT